MRYDDLVEKVDELENDAELSECIYIGAMQRLENVRKDLRILDDVKHVRRVIRPFLIQWGMMSRVAGRQDLDWKTLGVIIRELESEFDKIRNSKLFTYDFNNQTNSQTIRTIYSRIREIPYLGGQTSATKILHLFNPEIFVMWDIDILKDYNSRNSKVSSNPHGYVEFLKEVQKELRELLTEQSKKTGKKIEDIELELRKRYNNKTLARIIDEYNWKNAHPARY